MTGRMVPLLKDHTVEEVTPIKGGVEQRERIRAKKRKRKKEGGAEMPC